MSLNKERATLGVAMRAISVTAELRLERRVAPTFSRRETEVWSMRQQRSSKPGDRIAPPRLRQLLRPTIAAVSETISSMVPCEIITARSVATAESLYKRKL